MEWEMTHQEQKRHRLGKKMLMWLYVISMLMMFAGLTSAYIVKKGETENWLTFQLPPIFLYNTIVLLVSSLTLFIAYRGYVRAQQHQLLLFLWFTLVLGIAFLTGQYLGWVELVKQGVYFVGNPGGSFIYVFTALHGLHLIAGIIAMLVIAVRATLMRIKDALELELLGIFWHALDFLWLYLFLFLYVNQH
jgi:cytochrome c oxidase subunit 3